MKRTVLVIGVLLLTSGAAYSQVGVNTETPKATLEVTATSTAPTSAEGIIAPRLTRDQLIKKDAQYSTAQTGAIVYVTDLSGTTTTKTAGVSKVGYYYYDGALWQAFTPAAGASVEPWFKVADGKISTLNTDDSYLNAKVVVGGNAIASINGGTNNAQLTVTGGDASIHGLTVGTGAGNIASNVALGTGALPANKGKANIVAIGSNAAKVADDAGSSVIIGSESMLKAINPWKTVAIGSEVFPDLTAVTVNTNNNNIAIGYQSGKNLVSGSNNIFIGGGVGSTDQTGTAVANLSNRINIGNALYGTYSGTAAGGTISIGKVTPDAGMALDVNGKTQLSALRLTGNGVANGNILTTNASGDATWATPASLGIKAVTASNGLTATGNNVTIGGTMTSSSTINVNDGTYFYILNNTTNSDGIPTSRLKVTTLFELGSGSPGAGKILTSSDQYGTGAWKTPTDLNMVTGATNGLSKNGTDVELGGTLAKTTTITTDQSKDIIFAATAGKGATKLQNWVEINSTSGSAPADGKILTAINTSGALSWKTPTELNMVTGAINGLSKNGTDVQLGGTLANGGANINTNGQTLTVSGTGKTAISSNLQITSGATQGNNKVLASDASGNATWKDVQSLIFNTGGVETQKIIYKGPEVTDDAHSITSGPFKFAIGENSILDDGGIKTGLYMKFTSSIYSSRGREANSTVTGEDEQIEFFVSQTRGFGESWNMYGTVGTNADEKNKNYSASNKQFLTPTLNATTYKAVGEPITNPMAVCKYFIIANVKTNGTNPVTYFYEVTLFRTANTSKAGVNNGQQVLLVQRYM